NFRGIGAPPVPESSDLRSLLQESEFRSQESEVRISGEPALLKPNSRTGPTGDPPVLKAQIYAASSILNCSSCILDSVFWLLTPPRHERQWQTLQDYLAR